MTRRRILTIVLSCTLALGASATAALADSHGRHEKKAATEEAREAAKGEVKAKGKEASKEAAKDAAREAAGVDQKRPKR